MSAIKGRVTSKRIESSTNDLRDSENFVTVVPIGSNRNALDTVTMGYYLVQSSVSAGASSTNEILNYTAHGAKVGDIVRIEVSANPIDEFEVPVKEVIDANNVRLAAILSAAISTGDTISILRPVAQRMASDGSTLSSITVPPIQFVLDGVNTDVEKDTVTPSNTVGLPVQIVGTSGVDINITAGDINVQTSHAGGSYDSMRIGDGTNLMAVNASLEAQVNDADANASLLLIAADADTLAQTVGSTGAAVKATGVSMLGSDGTNSRLLKTDSSGELQIDVLSSALPSGAATAANQTTANTSLSSIVTNTTGLATQATLAALEAKFPSSLGQKNEASSLSVTLSTENEQDLAGIRTAVEIIDNAVSGSEMQVDIVSAGPIVTESNFDSKIGSLTETAPGSDTASSGLNGRLQRIAQRLTSLISLFPASIGQQNMAGSLSVTIASNQSSINTVPQVPAAVTTKQAAVSFGTSAVRLTHDGAAPSSTRRALKFIIEPPAGDVNYYVGSSSVASSGANRGIRVYPGTLYSWDNDPNEYYIISDTASQTVFVTEAE